MKCNMTKLNTMSGHYIFSTWLLMSQPLHLFSKRGLWFNSQLAYLLIVFGNLLLPAFEYITEMTFLHSWDINLYLFIIYHSIICLLFWLYRMCSLVIISCTWWPEELILILVLENVHKYFIILCRILLLALL